MDRREFLNGVVATGSTAASLSLLGGLGGLGVAGAAASEEGSESSAALAELQALVNDIERGFADPAWRLRSPADYAEARRSLSHALQHALEAWVEISPEYPAFVRFVTPEKKLLGDNPDAVYFTTPTSAQYVYRIRGNLADATYTSFTAERRNPKGGLGRVGATLNDSQFEVAADGSYEILASSKKQPGNWLRLDDDAVSVTTRHYYERERSVAADRLHHIPIVIENLGEIPPRPAPTDASIAAGLRRAAAFLEGAVAPPMSSDKMPSYVSVVPNQLPTPQVNEAQGDVGFEAVDNVYSMAPFALRPDQALVIRGRYPKCRFANVTLWNRFLQTLDYSSRQVSLNRKQTRLEADGSFKVVVAGRDPGVPNWLDTEGRPFGSIFWRFQLPEEAIEPLVTKVVPISEVSTA